LPIIITSLFLQTALAQDKSPVLVPLPSVDDFTRGNDGWAFGLGLGIEYESAYEGADEFEVEANPAGGLQYRRGNDIFFWAGEALGWRGIRSNRWLFEAIVGFDEGREESDSEDGRLNGLGDGEEGAEVRLQVRRAFEDDWRTWIDGRIVTSDNGSLGLLGVGSRFSGQNDGSGHEIAIALVVQDSEYANKDFGIDAEQSTASGLAESNVSGGFRSIGINYNYRHYINDNWQVIGESFYEGYGNKVKDSPITRNNYEAEVAFGFIYVF